MPDPILKWAGGKRWLISSEQFSIPDSYERYIEPFLGGAAVFFHLAPHRALLSDSNADLIELYEIVRDDPSGLRTALEAHQALHSEEHYYLTRSIVPTDARGRAARMLYLNRTCWNGLYRVNLKGQFNVPIGTKNKVILEGETFYQASKMLKNTELRCSDFSETINQASEGDFLFVDPPYTVQHNLNGFVKYNERIFSWGDQIRLRDSVHEAIRRGTAVVVTNADHASVRELYKGICEYKSLLRSSVLSGKADRRGKTSEAMFSANLNI